jgi:GAF domain-containing protein
MTTPNPSPPSEQPTTVVNTTRGLQSLAADLEAIAEKLDVKSVLIMRSEPSSMVVAATAGAASAHYPVGGAGQKAGDAADRIPLYCERVVSSGETLFVRDSRADAIFAGNEDETAFGLSNYLGLPVRNSDGNVVGTVCVLDDHSREYDAGAHDELDTLRRSVEAILRSDATGLETE